MPPSLAPQGPGRKRGRKKSPFNNIALRSKKKMGQQELGQETGNGNTNLHFGCNGCFKVPSCGGKEIGNSSTPMKRASSLLGKLFECHSIFPDIAKREPDPKATRRQFGEAAIQY